MTTKNAHGSTLEPKLKDLDNALAALEVPEELFRIIHHPGYTTPIEMAFINNLIDTIGKQTAIIKAQMKTLLDASREIISDK